MALYYNATNNKIHMDILDIKIGQLYKHVNGSIHRITGFKSYDEICTTTLYGSFIVNVIGIDYFRNNFCLYASREWKIGDCFTNKEYPGNVFAITGIDYTNSFPYITGHTDHCWKDDGDMVCIKEYITSDGKPLFSEKHPNALLGVDDSSEAKWYLPILKETNRIKQDLKELKLKKIK